MTAESLTDKQGRLLLAIARDAIAQALGVAHTAPNVEADWLAEPGACFVTLTQQGELRGCIGSLQAHRSLLADVRHNALAAALPDPRFAPLGAAELARTRIEVSLLSASQPMQFTDEADALAQLRPGVDGVVFEFGYHRSTFLPQVWEQLPQPRQFMAQLKRKAGLPADFWSDQVTLSRYTVSK
ncbi:MAG: AmmeMemoRadiSam system protein A, partial [Gallionella sp.]|nr:AmmeMemoRadiSam system protein A [Gallionella sp.]